MLYNALPDINSFKVFGCLCYAFTLQAHRTKLQSRARKSVFLGYKSGYKGYVLYDIDTKEIFISRNVTFHESILPYNSSTPHSTSNWQYFTSSNPTTPFIDIPAPSIPPSSPPITPTIPPITDHPPLRISSRTKHTPTYLQVFICSTSHTKQTNQLTSKYPLSDFLSHSKLSNSHSLFTLSITTHIEPKTYVEAVKHDCWKQAMQNELTALHQTGTWQIVDLPPAVKPIGCRWIFNVKHNADGSVERYKARLVAKGYDQIEGLDYFDTYSPVAKLPTVRFIIALASINNWHLMSIMPFCMVSFRKMFA